jgi:hypothetical protein
MADYYTVYLSAESEADRESYCVWFAPTEAEANVIRDFFNDQFDTNTYTSYLISDADVTGSGTLEDVDATNLPGWKYRAIGNERYDAANRVLVEGLFEDSSSSSSGSSSSFDLTSSAGSSLFTSSASPPPPF